MSYKKTFQSILFLVVANLLVKPFWILGIDRVVQNELGESAYGIYFALFNYSIIFQIILDFGIQNFNSSAIAQDPKKLQSYLPNLLIAKLGLSVVYFVVAVVSFYLLGYDLAHLKQLLFILLINQILISLIYYLRSCLTGLHKFKLDAFFSIFDKLLMILIVGSMLYYNVFNIELNIINFVKAQLAAFGLNAILLFMSVLSYTTIRHFKVDIGLIKSIAIKSLPYALSVFLMSIYLRMDAIMIERIIPDRGALEAGIYAQSFRLIDAFNMLGILFANVLIPSYAKKIGDKKAMKILLTKSYTFLLLLAIPITIAVFVWRNSIIEVLYTNAYDSSAKILGVLIFSFLAYSSMHIFSSLLTAVGKLKWMNFIFAFGIILNFVTNLILIPKYAAFGAAITTTVSEVLVLLLIMGITFNYLRNKV